MPGRRRSLPGRRRIVAADGLRRLRWPCLRGSADGLVSVLIAHGGDYSTAPRLNGAASICRMRNRAQLRHAKGFVDLQRVSGRAREFPGLLGERPDHLGLGRRKFADVAVPSRTRPMMPCKMAAMRKKL